jgi:hypothetical protein
MGMSAFQAFLETNNYRGKHHGLLSLLFIQQPYARQYSFLHNGKASIASAHRADGHDRDWLCIALPSMDVTPEEELAGIRAATAELYETDGPLSFGDQCACDSGTTSDKNHHHGTVGSRVVQLTPRRADLPGIRILYTDEDVRWWCT